MKNILIFSLLILAHHGFSQSNFDFRMVRWKNTSAVVRATEGGQKPIVNQDKLLYREIPLGGRLVGLEYNFNQDSLYSTNYFYFTDRGVSRTDVINAYVYFNSLLTEKYGKPNTERKDSEGRAVSWETRRTIINLTVAYIGVQGYGLQVEYISREWFEKAKPELIRKADEKRKSQLKDF